MAASTYAVTSLQWMFDTLLEPDLFKAIVLFVAFGLLMTLSWVSLDAPDVVLAEASIGAGLTGVLLFAAHHPALVGGSLQ